MAAPERPILTAEAGAALQQGGPAALWVYLSDKGEGDRAAFARAMTSAGASVSQASRLRRQRLLGRAFAPDYTDAPVLDRYVRAIEAAGGRIRHVSRWLNAVSVEADAAAARRLADLPFVTRITPVSHTERAYLPPGDYGPSLTQNLGVNSPAAHDSGYSGAGIVVAIFDTGFRKDHVATAPIKRIAEWDFVHSDGETANQAGDASTEWNHGTGTWSLLAAYWPGELVGPAFNATFVLAKVLDPNSTSASEDHWVAAAEWADSIGVDIVSSSIVTSHNYNELDGHTTAMAQAANTLTRHGILVVCAMGNSGPGTGTLWTPADCDSVLAVGSVNASYTISSFSSRGPTFDGRGKPDLVAQGENALWADPTCPTCVDSYPGTSIATPLVSGTAALVQEAHPEWSSQQVRYALKSTAFRVGSPDSTTYGWGRPNAIAAIYGSTLGKPVYPKPFSLAKPDSAALIAGSPVTFRWRRAVDPTPGDVVSYSLQLKKVSTGQVVYTTTTADTFTTYSGSLNAGTNYVWHITATDLAGHPRACREDFKFKTGGGSDLAPVVAAPPTVSGSEGTLVSFTVTASDPDGDPIYSLTANTSTLPPGNNASLAPNGSNTSGVFTWLPGSAGAGTYSVVFTATNIVSGMGTTMITIANVDFPPAVVSPDHVSALAGDTVAFQVTASDPDGQAITSLTANTSGLPPGNGASFVSNPAHTAGDFTWNSTEANAGDYSVTFQATNALVGSALTSIHLAPPVPLPQISASADTLGLQGSFIQLSARATEPADDFQLLTITVSGAPASLVFTHTPSVNPATATLHGTLTTADAAASPFFIVWTVTDERSTTAKDTTILYVDHMTGVNDPAGSPGAPFFHVGPNPFQSRVQIAFRVSGEGHTMPVSVRIYDVHGRLVRTLLERSTSQATTISWDGNADSGEKVASGIYYCRLEHGRAQVIRRIVRLE
ncbi:MAG: S8 family serine peptidase [Candidatus Eiseniibacteriota bacterium]